MSLTKPKVSKVTLAKANFEQRLQGFVKSYGGYLYFTAEISQVLRIAAQFCMAQAR